MFFSGRAIKNIIMKNTSVLIIESDVAVLANLARKFEKLDILTITEEDGYEGYYRACKESPSHIVSETLLPTLSGYKLSHLLKYDSRYQSIKITLMTSNELELDSQTFHQSRADGILKKPFKFLDLAKKMDLST